MRNLSFPEEYALSVDSERFFLDLCTLIICFLSLDTNTVELLLWGASIQGHLYSGDTKFDATKTFA